jgi:hypothetical protein
LTVSSTRSRAAGVKITCCKNSSRSRSIAAWVLGRFEMLRVSHLPLLEVACALIVFRQGIVIHGEALRNASLTPLTPAASMAEC